LLRCRAADILGGTNDVSTLLYNVRCFLGVVFQLLRYGVRFCCAFLLPKVVLAARLTTSESQLGEMVERVRPHTEALPRLRFRPAFRIVWVVLSKLLEG
jgi:hypothetical protein